MLQRKFLLLSLTLALSVAPASAGETGAPFALSSGAFGQGKSIPAKYSCDGEDVSPPLHWGAAPPGTKSLALIMDDPDAPMGTWVHWVQFNIPASASGLAENIPPVKNAASGTPGVNSWPKPGYGGPCPPGGTHRYFFKLYALDALLDLESSATKAQITDAMKGHILKQVELMGIYSRH